MPHLQLFRKSCQLSCKIHLNVMTCCHPYCFYHSPTHQHPLTSFIMAVSPQFIFLLLYFTPLQPILHETARVIFVKCKSGHDWYSSADNTSVIFPHLIQSKYGVLVRTPGPTSSAPDLHSHWPYLLHSLPFPLCCTYSGLLADSWTHQFHIYLHTLS